MIKKSKNYPSYMSTIQLQMPSALVAVLPTPTPPPLLAPILAPILITIITTKKKKKSFSFCCNYDPIKSVLKSFSTEG